MKTGDEVTRNGVYSNHCCSCEIPLQKRQVFPRCPKCMKLTLWDFVEIGTGKLLKRAA